MERITQLKSNILFALIIFFGMYGIEVYSAKVIHNYEFSLDQIDWPAAQLFFYFTLAMSFCGRKIRTGLLLLMLGMTLIQTLNYQYFRTYIQPISFYLAFAFPKEVTESLLGSISTMILPGMVVLIFGGIVYFLVQGLGRPRFTSAYSSMILVVMLTADLLGTYYLMNDRSGKLWDRQAHMVLPIPHILAVQNVYRSFKYYVIGIVPKKLFGNISIFPEIPPPVMTTKAPNINIMLIIGEALRAEQLSLLGYSRNNTTPRLSHLEGLRASKIYASGTMSITGVGGILNRLKHPGMTQQIANHSNCMFRLAKDNAFSTYFVTAYPRDLMKIMESVICKKHIDHYVSRSEFSKESSTHDMALVEYLEHIDFNENNFIVLNQRGSHSPYENRYPPEFNKFEFTYDNTVLYTDHVLTEIIETVKRKSQKPTYILYSADHGELIHEEGLNGHGWFKRQVYEVPFLFYAHGVNKQETLEDIPYIQSHFDLSTYVIKLLGYDLDVDRSEQKEVYVNGSDVDGLAGYLRLTLDQGNVESSELFR